MVRSEPISSANGQRELFRETYAWHLFPHDGAPSSELFRKGSIVYAKLLEQNLILVPRHGSLPHISRSAAYFSRTTVYSQTTSD